MGCHGISLDVTDAQAVSWLRAAFARRLGNGLGPGRVAVPLVDFSRAPDRISPPGTALYSDHLKYGMNRMNYGAERLQGGDNPNLLPLVYSQASTYHYLSKEVPAELIALDYALGRSQYGAVRQS